MYNVFQMRAGAPDKFNMYTSGRYNLIKRDGVNLVDYSIDELNSIDDNTRIICTSENDILYANLLDKRVQNKLFLPTNGKGEIIDYYKFVPKDSKFYQGVNSSTPFIYPLKDSLTIPEFTYNIDKIRKLKKFVIKVQIGSGSRGVYVINPDRTPQPGSREQYVELSNSLVDDILMWASKSNCNILVQDLAYRDLNIDKKYNCNFMIRNGKLLLYKWNVPDNDSTNYDHAYFVRSEFTDNVVNSLVNYLVQLGVTDGLFGVDGYTDYNNYVSMIEVNWRHENSMMEFEAYGVDFIDAFLFPEDYSMDKNIPTGKYPFIRYWRCSMFNLPHGGKLNNE